MTRRFDYIKEKAGEIVAYVMSSPGIPDDESIRFKLRLSVEEVVVNVVQYAYGSGSGFMEVSTESDEETFTVKIKDGGIPFNPLEKEDPDITLPAEERGIGGLGIFICKQIMDEISYKYEDGCNILTITKKIKR